MSSRALASILFAFLSIWLALGSLSMISDVYLGWISGSLLRHEDPGIHAASLPLLAQVLGVALAGAFFLRIIPAIVVFRCRHRWAERLTPADDAPAAVGSPPLLYVVGLMLLGIYLLVIGFQSVITNVIFIFATSEFSRPDYLARLAGSAVLPTVGAWLFFHGRSHIE